MKITKYLSVSITIIITAIFLVSCSDDDDGGTPMMINEEEVITTLNLRLTPMGGGTPIELSSRDLDGDGPNPPIVTVENLSANTTYEGVVEVLNETESPAEDITEEVAEEDEDHQFFYQTIGNAALSVDYTDMDADNNPVGIQFTLTTTDASSGDLVVTLRHLLDKSAAGVSDGDISNAGGDTDVEVSFPITIE